MKAFALAALAAIGLGTAPSARGDVWFDNPRSGFGVPDANPHHGGPYFVAGFGDDNYGVRRRYWGGPYWYRVAPTCQELTLRQPPCTLS